MQPLARTLPDVAMVGILSLGVLAASGGRIRGSFVQTVLSGGLTAVLVHDA